MVSNYEPVAEQVSRQRQWQLQAGHADVPLLPQL